MIFIFPLILPAIDGFPPFAMIVTVHFSIIKELAIELSYGVYDLFEKSIYQEIE
jgi:hypothetical protein